MAERETSGERLDEVHEQVAGRGECDGESVG
jgi:hypothetical protein